jgi:hypothetical protein
MNQKKRKPRNSINRSKLSEKQSYLYNKEYSTADESFSDTTNLQLSKSNTNDTDLSDPNSVGNGAKFRQNNKNTNLLSTCVKVIAAIAALLSIVAILGSVFWWASSIDFKVNSIEDDIIENNDNVKKIQKFNSDSTYQHQEFKLQLERIEKKISYNAKPVSTQKEIK